MFAQPADLPEALITDALWDGWQFRAQELRYQAVGFGSHHWLAADGRGRSLFVTVDDLVAKRRSYSDTTDAAFGRLRRAFATALSLRQDAGLRFVLAPVPAVGGQVLTRLAARYSLVVHPYLAGSRARPDGKFESSADRLAVLEQLIALHAATAVSPRSDDFVVPLAAELRTAMVQTSDSWTAGPYGSRARELLAVHAEAVTTLLTAYGHLVRGVAARPERMVITHGEPHAANALRTGWRVRPGRLGQRAARSAGARSVGARRVGCCLRGYSAAAGVPVDQDALTLYRLWYDLSEIAGYIGVFRSAHEDTADTAEAWRNLEYFLRPAERWPGLLRGHRSAGRS